MSRPLFAFLALLLPALSLGAVSITESTTVSLYRGTTKGADHPSWDACQTAARALAQVSTATTGTVTYQCKTEVRKLVAVYSANPLSATLSWTAPTLNTDGSTLTDLAGFRIFYGNSAANLDHVQQVADPAMARYIVDGLSPGTWYFGVKAYTTAGIESDLSNIASKAM